jgi:hypothetical protein
LLFALHGLAVGKWFAFGVAGESRGLGWGVAYYLGFFSRQDFRASHQHVAYQHTC